MNLTEKEKKKIEKEVDKYIKSLAKKDETGTIIDDGLRNSPDMLLALYKEKFFLELTEDDARFYAKMYFKDKLPYKQWRERIGKEGGELARQIEDFQEMQDPRYTRITPRREDR
jgi:hypothetical protein